MTLFGYLFSGEGRLRFVKLKVQIKLFLLFSQPAHSIVVSIELLLDL